MSKLEVFQGLDKAFPLTVLDDAGAAVDLTSATLLFAVFDDIDPANFVFSISGGGIVKSGTPTPNVATVTVTSTETATARSDLQWLLIDTLSNIELLNGRLVIKPAAIA